MSKKKKKKEPRAEAPAAAEVAERDEAADDGEAEATDKESHEAAAEAHGDAHGHGHDAHDPVEEDRPRNGLIALVTLITIITLISFIIFVRELFNSWSAAEIQSKVLGRQNKELIALRAAEKGKLTKYQWVNQKDGVVGIPTDRAIELTIAAYRNPPPAPAPTMVAPAPKPEEVKPEEKPEEKKGVEGKDDKGGKKENKGDVKEGGK